MTSKSLPTKARARVVRDASRPFPNTVALSATYELAPSGSLREPATLRIPLHHRVARGTPVLGAHLRRPGDTWTPLRVGLSADRRFALVRVRHFSLIEIFTSGVIDIIRELKEGVFDGLTAGLVAEAKPPSCNDEGRARSDGYSINSDSKDTVYWCFGLERGERLLRVVNNRRYPLAMTHAGLPVIDQGGGGVRWERLSRFFSGREAILSPREQLTFAVRLDRGATGTVHTRFDGVGFSLYQLQVGVESVLEILTRFGAGSGIQAVDLVDKLLAVPNCASAIAGTAGDLLAKCFSKSLLADVLGPKAYLVTPFMWTGEILSFFRSSFNALGDQLHARDRYRILIRHAATPAPTPPPPPSSSRTPLPPAPQTPTTTFDVGDDFDLECQVAWPTAPYRTSNSIQMTMQCVGLPSEFLLVQVTYPDPSFPITAERVRVRGKVVDIAKSEYGFRLLVVVAERIGY
jgi:hypothetical protein